jgi:Zn-dependent peptidase ImmA (M78 family)
MKGGSMTQARKDDEATDGPSAKSLLPRVRTLMPARPLAFYEHLQIAERQATQLHHLLKQQGPAADLTWLTKLSGITVVVQPRWKMEGISGLTQWDDGHWVIGVNKSNPHARRRFTLAHELKHVIDANRDKITYRAIDVKQREAIADYFAACYLMPKLWLRKVWTGGLQDPEALAGLFRVSLQAMDKRLKYLGFVDTEPDRPTATYFRRAPLLPGAAT